MDIKDIEKKIKAALRLINKQAIAAEARNQSLPELVRLPTSNEANPTIRKRKQRI